MCLGIVGRITRIWDEGGFRMAHVAGQATDRAVCLMYHPDVTVGTPVLAHMGFVIEVLDEQRLADAEALRTGAQLRIGSPRTPL